LEPISFRTPLALLLISLGAIAATWWWLATPVALPRAPIDPNAKLQCVSYAPFRGEQTPLQSTARIPAEQIAQDLAQLAALGVPVGLAFFYRPSVFKAKGYEVPKTLDELTHQVPETT